MNQALSESLSQLPHKPGVYHFYDSKERLLYVGKAIDLYKRVHSYFKKNHISPWTELLVSEIASVKVIEVSTELEALMLENSLIKSLKPKYNIQRKDDKTYPFLRVSNEDFPTFTITRVLRRDKARYFGPFQSATYLRSMLKLIQAIYGIKIAHDRSYEARSNVPNQIGLGARNLDHKASYQAKVAEAIKFLSTPQPQMEKVIKQAMEDAAKQEQFELAASFRNRLQSLQELRQSQSLFGASQTNRDYIGVARSGKLLSVYMLFERNGGITNHRHLTFESVSDLPDDVILNQLVEQLYTQGVVVPKEIVVSAQPSDATVLEVGLKHQSGRNVNFIVPQRGELKKRLNTATENAAYQLQLERTKKSRREKGLYDLATLLNLPNIPRRIEAFDISNLGATNIVGASIVFIDGKPAKKEYRKYNINTPEGQDDFASMRELVFRRLSNPDRPLPDLLLIDGGKGQLSAAQDAMKLAKREVQMMSLAKKEEILFQPRREEPIILPPNSDAILFITAIRDEVHRFVINFHRQRRSKSLLPKN